MFMNELFVVDFINSFINSFIFYYKLDLESVISKKMLIGISTLFFRKNREGREKKCFRRSVEDEESTRGAGGRMRELLRFVTLYVVAA